MVTKLIPKWSLYFRTCWYMSVDRRCVLLLVLNLVQPVRLLLRRTRGTTCLSSHSQIICRTGLCTYVRFSRTIVRCVSFFVVRWAACQCAPESTMSQCCETLVCLVHRYKYRARFEPVQPVRLLRMYSIAPSTCGATSASLSSHAQGILHYDCSLCFFLCD